MSPKRSFKLSRLRDGLSPFRVYWFPRLGSTNDHTAAMRRRGELFAPAVILAGKQIAGRGRGTNQWWSAEGSLTVTFALPITESIQPHQLPLLAGLAVRNAAAELSGDDAVSLKWPNDLLHNGRKLAGILCERLDGIDLVGLGLNVNMDIAEAPAHLQQRITSLQAIAGGPVDPNDALISIARRLRMTLDYAADRPFAEVLREYELHHALRGKSVTVIEGDDHAPLHGRVEGLDEMGRLLLRSAGKLHHIIVGQVQGGY